MRKYVSPSWGAPPPVGGEFGLEIIKDGVLLRDKLILSGSGRHGDYFLVGRAEDVVDFALAHPSVSRTHAAFQFRNDGALFLLDFSAQGTLVNKKACLAGVYERLFPGDQLKFGASSRLYIVIGPPDQELPEYDSENLRAYRNRIAENTLEVARRAKESLSVSWKQDEGLEELLAEREIYEEEPGDKQKMLVDEDYFVSKQDKIVLEKIHTKQKKIEFMKEESKRISRKEGNQENGLSAGQAQTIEKNKILIAQLENEITDISSAMQAKQLNGKLEKRMSGGAAEEIIEDSCLDETTKNLSENWRVTKKQQSLSRKAAPVAPEGSAWTLESLLRERDANEDKHDELISKMREIQEIVNVKSTSKQSDLDDYEKLLNEELLHETLCNLRKVGCELERLVEKNQTLEQLIKIATPAIPSLCGTKRKLDRTFE